MLAMRQASAPSASSSARQTIRTGASSRPAGGDDLAAAAATVSFLRMGKLTGSNDKGPGMPGPLEFGWNCRLLQRVVDRGELGVEVGAEAVDHSDNRKRNAGCNQAVFDRGGAGLVLHKTRNQVLHRVTPCTRGWSN